MSRYVIFESVQFDPSTGSLIVGGCVIGFLSELIGSAGPLGAAVLLTLELPPVAYVATEAVTALAMHGVKSVVYRRYVHREQVWLLAIALGVAMILGRWLEADHRANPIGAFRKFCRRSSGADFAANAVLWMRAKNPLK